MLGRIHSFESCGTVDGPGVRVVVFMQGCHLRCLYCHNPDTWHLKDGKEVSVESVFQEINKYKSFMNSCKGGVTITGGEPLLQPDFVREILKRCKEEGIHTALDTSGCFDLELHKDILEYVDLFLLDLKSINPKMHKKITGMPIDKVIKFAWHLSDSGKKIWVRHVLVPGITDDDNLLHEMARFISNLKTVECVEILPFHKMGEYKWQELGYDYTLADIDPPTDDRVENAKSIFTEYGLDVS